MDVFLEADDDGLALIYLTGTIENTGAFGWKVPSNLSPGLDYQLQVYTPNYAYYDFSDDYFSVLEKLTLSSPNGGERLTRGTVHTVTWDSPNAGERHDRQDEMRCDRGDVDGEFQQADQRRDVDDTAANEMCVIVSGFAWGYSINNIGLKINPPPAPMRTPSAPTERENAKALLLFLVSSGNGIHGDSADRDAAQGDIHGLRVLRVPGQSARQAGHSGARLVAARRL